MKCFDGISAEMKCRRRLPGVAGIKNAPPAEGLTDGAKGSR